MPVILADTGPIVAYLREKDAFFGWAYEQFSTLPLPFLTCEAVLTEAAYVLYRSGGYPEAVMELVSAGALRVGFHMEKEADALKNLLQRYRDIPMDLADACMVRMSELYPDSALLTVDSDFLIYRKHERDVIPLITPR
ncbi:hypothetical protein GQ464_002660 [Rhodocaloribacter litoris]|uniref:type II toxin-antitoxin system VapC family toxin n=1 Tax=Rhodocaloribacter litoris TaxID=2558931 RepID=UPI001E615887|nr:hypothetical protein [Rhodocaloribacter litoris]QXD15868.1 hypothetical protein GQ464_002660 [Rhodocaloribacter litoris]